MSNLGAIGSDCEDCWPATCVAQGVDLFGATLDGALLNGAVIYAADLRETSWRFASLAEARPLL